MTNEEAEKCSKLAKVIDDHYRRKDYLASEMVLAIDEYMSVVKRDDFRYYTRKEGVVTVAHPTEDGSEVIGKFNVGELRAKLAAEQAMPAVVAQQATANNAFDLTAMMAADFKPKAADTAQQIGQPQQTNNAPAFMKARGPDFSSPPKTSQTEAPKLTSQSLIVRLDDYDTKPKLATDELMKRGAGVSVERKAYRLDGTEVVASYEMNKAGNVVHTAYDGTKTEMSFGQAKRQEIEHLAQLNTNALIAINMMATDPKFSLRQGDATYSVKNGFFVRQADDGTIKKEPLANTQQRFMARGREIDAMLPKKTMKAAEPMQSVQPKSEKAQSFSRMADRAVSFAKPDQDKALTTTVEQGM